MLTVTEAKAWIEANVDIGHPDWHLTVEAVVDPLGSDPVLVFSSRLYVDITHTTPDSRPNEGEQTIIVGFRRVLPQNSMPLDSEAVLLDFVRRFWHDCWRHEADEWLRIGGELVNDPHTRSPECSTSP